MGWARKNLTDQQRIGIAESLFTVTEQANSGGKLWLNGLCPLHGDRNPSFGYNVTDDVFHCLTQCSKDGDLVDLFCLVEGLEPSKGFIEFKNRFSSPVAGQPLPKNTNPPPKPKQQQSELPEVDLDQMRAAYDNFPELPENWVRRLGATKGWSAAAIRQLGLKHQTHYRCKYTGQLRDVTRDHGRIVIPIWDQSDPEQLTNLRLYDPASTGRDKMISWGRGIGGNRIWPVVKRERELVWLCEGEGDTICARSLGLEAYTQTAKRKKWPDEQVALFKDRDVVICYDADTAGVNYASGAAESLLGTAKSIRVINWPDFMLENGELPAKHGQDLTNFIKDHGRGVADLENLLAEATMVDTVEDTRNETYWEFFGSGASGRDVFQPRLLADRLLQDFSLLNDPTTGLLYRWSGSYYERYERDNLTRQAIKYLGVEAKSSRYEDAVKQAVLLSTMPSGRNVNDRDGWVCINNGMFNTDTFELRPHAKDYYATIKIDVDFDPSRPADCPRWRQFCAETIQTPEAIEQLQEFYGYCLTRETRYEMYLVTIGDGGDGKSTAQRVLRNLCGKDNCTSVSFDGLEDQFQRASLYNKMVNLSSEVGGRVMDSEYLKKIVSGDSITAAFKHKDGFEFSPYCKLVFAVNRMPKVKDNTDGLYRRLLPIWFKRQFLPGDPARDPHLEEKLLAELPGIFNWALIGLERLRQRGCFNLDVPETRKLLADYRRQNSPIYAFVEDCCLIGGEFSVKKDELFQQYRSYCGLNGYGAVHRENFFVDLRHAVKGLKNHRPTEDGKRVNAVKGLGLVAVEGLT